MKLPLKKRAVIVNDSDGCTISFSVPKLQSMMEKSCQGYVPQYTSKATGWALRVFKSWRKEYNERVSEQCPENLLEEP